jgi:serine/threonine-protein kinase HipA
LIRHIFVWVRRPDGAIHLAGELATTAPHRSSGRFESEFEYARSWVSESGAFALDPVSLPLDASRRFRAEMLYPPLAVFEDALPDEWGRRLLAAAITADEGGTPTLPEMLLRMRGGGTGALLFTATDTAPRPDQSVPSTALSKLLAAAAQFEAGTMSFAVSWRAAAAPAARGPRRSYTMGSESGSPNFPVARAMMHMTSLGSKPPV